MLLVLGILSYNYVAITTASIFNEWTCIGLKSRINLQRPYQTNIGDLPLVVWRDPNTGDLNSRINICKHMGSKLDTGKITENGCLKCPYHGLEHSKEDQFGEVREHEGKLFWAHKPTHPLPYCVPFYNNPTYARSFLQVDMDCSLVDSALNTMDLRHPEYVHGGALGFGNSVPPANVEHHYYTPKCVGLSFDYASKMSISKLNRDTTYTQNFHMYIYPTFSWSKVTFHRDNHLIIAVNLQPIAPKKTRWYVTVCNNYMTSPLQTRFVDTLASTILSQDFVQMRRQSPDSELKRALMFEHVFPDEDVVVWVHDMLREYRYPDAQICADLYKKCK